MKEERIMETKDKELNEKSDEDVDAKQKRIEALKEELAKELEPAEPEEAGAEPEKKAEPEKAEKETPPDRTEISIVHQDGKTLMKGPANPILLMKIFGEALQLAADEFLAIAKKAKAMEMFDAGPDVGYTPEAKKVIQAVKRNG